MKDMRKYPRFKLDVVDLISRVSLVGKVEIIDISLGGVALKADRKLNMGKECLVMLEYERKQFNVKGVVVRSELSGIEEQADGGTATIYSMGIFFKEESAGKMKDFLDSIANDKKIQVRVHIDWLYRDIWFCITTPSEKILHLPKNFSIREISQNGVIIQTDEQLNINSMVLLELALDAFEPVSFMGKIVSCRAAHDRAHPQYDVGVEFPELTELDRSMLMKFIDFIRDYKNFVK